MTRAIPRSDSDAAGSLRCRSLCRGTDLCDLVGDLRRHSLHPRYTIRPPGASGELQGITVRALSLTRSDQLADAEGGDPGVPDPGAVWVVAELEAVRHDPVKESIFMVPARYADQLVGIALTGDSSAARTPVIRPPEL